jgi:hypothetical protein
MHCLVGWLVCNACFFLLGEHLQMTRTGTCNLEMSFSAALSASVTVIILSWFDALVTIDRDRNPTANYSLL